MIGLLMGRNFVFSVPPSCHLPPLPHLRECSVTGVFVTTGDLGLIWMKHKSKAYKYYLHFIYMNIYISSPGWYSICIWHYWLTE